MFAHNIESQEIKKCAIVYLIRLTRKIESEESDIDMDQRSEVITKCTLL
jgi:hypothetical protein